MRSEKQLSFFVGRENLFINFASVVLRRGPSLISEGHKICYAFTVWRNMLSSAVLRIETRQRHPPPPSPHPPVRSSPVHAVSLSAYYYCLFMISCWNVTEGILLFTLKKETVLYFFFFLEVKWGRVCHWILKVASPVFSNNDISL